MKAFRPTISLVTLVAMIAGCGGSTSPSNPMPQSLTRAHQSSGRSWMLPEAKNEDLLYVVHCNNAQIWVLSYPKGKVVGVLATHGASDCSDSSGNIFITLDSTVTEYAHGQTTPLQTLALPGNYADGCAVDPLTNNLAVGYDFGLVAVFADETGTPTSYASPIGCDYPGYDNQGNLFVDGYDGQNAGLAELPKGADEFMRLTISDDVGQPGRIQWDGKYMTYQSSDGSNPIISQLSISGSSATIVGTTRLREIRHNPAASWLYHDRLIVPYPRRGTSSDTIGYWKYPKGGRPTKQIKDIPGGSDFQAVTMSVAPSH